MPPPDRREIESLVGAGDYRTAADRLAAHEPIRAAELYAKVLDYGRVADCMASAGDGVAAARAALKAADPERVSAIHARVLRGVLSGLSQVTEVYLKQGRLGLAADVAEVMGRRAEAAELAGDAGDCLRAGRLWESIGDVERAISAFGDAMPQAAEDLCRLHLRLGQPRQALAALGQTERCDALAPLLALTYLRLGLTEAARAVQPHLGDLVVARSRLEREWNVVVDPGFVGSVRIDGPEVGGEGISFVGELSGEPCFVRLLPTADAAAQTLAVFDPPLPGVPRLMRYTPGSSSIVVSRRGHRLSVWMNDGPSTARVVTVLQSVARTLHSAHQRAIFHGHLRVDDVRVLPGCLATLDGWHRAHALMNTATRAAQEMSLVAPEVQLGRAATHASDVFALATLTTSLLDGIEAGAFTASDPALRPGMEALIAWLGRLQPQALRPLEDARGHVGAAPGPRFVLNEDGTYEDTMLGRSVRLIAMEQGVDDPQALAVTVFNGRRVVVATV